MSWVEQTPLLGAVVWNITRVRSPGEHATQEGAAGGPPAYSHGIHPAEEGWRTNHGIFPFQDPR